MASNGSLFSDCNVNLFLDKRTEKMNIFDYLIEIADRAENIQLSFDLLHAEAIKEANQNVEKYGAGTVIACAIAGVDINSLDS